MKKASVGLLVKNVLVLVFALIYLAPLYIAAVNSIKPYDEVIKAPLQLPVKATLQNFADAFQSSNMLALYQNSILITGLSVVLLIIITSMAAYIIARRTGKLYQALYIFSLAGIMIPPIVTLIPSIKTLSALHLLYTMPGLLLFYGGTYFSTTIFIYVGYIKTIPKSIDESAYMDGANPITTFFRIIFPLVKPCTATAVIFLGMWIWNDFLNPMYILGFSGGKTITTGIYNAIGTYTSKWNLVFANVLLASLPIIIAYLFMQKIFMKGLTSGAVKG
ncbi:MAG TPA: carbohydrate ABC transporter permease [Candidatus Limiplasma sp.]|nr:carbohydrate ABC transporter permease [Candidatus Limiplasma sp.]HRX08008.1 carbohydrate ABC transporter permease [Candidatus Limiplasma sp.]